MIFSSISGYSRARENYFGAQMPRKMDRVISRERPGFVEDRTDNRAMGALGCTREIIRIKKLRHRPSEENAGWMNKMYFDGTTENGREAKVRALNRRVATLNLPHLIGSFQIKFSIEENTLDSDEIKLNVVINLSRYRYIKVSFRDIRITVSIIQKPCRSNLQIRVQRITTILNTLFF